MEQTPSPTARPAPEGKMGERGNKKGKPADRLPFFISKSDLNGLAVNSFFFDSCFLTGKSTQVIQFSATNLTNLVHFDAVDSR